MQTEERWRELIRQFDKLTDQDCSEAEGNREQLITKLMARYQLTHRQAELRLLHWEESRD